MKMRIPVGPRFYKIQEIPLRHKAQHFVRYRKVRKISYGIILVPDLNLYRFLLIMGNFQKFLEQSELIHRLKSRCMDRVAAKVAEKISVLLQHDYIYACT